MLYLLGIVMFCTPQPTGPAAVASYADVDARYERGAVTIVAVRRGKYPKPTTAPRWKGRFLASALKGGKALAQVEFNFPLVAEAESPVDVDPEQRRLAEKLREGVTSTTTVRVPLPEGADSVSIWDAVSRKTVTRPLTEAKAPAARDPRAP